MGKAPRLFSITLAIEEAAHILGPAGRGGHQALHKRLLTQLEPQLERDDDLTVKLTDSDLGMIIRYMTQYGSGGFQGRLKKAFWRSFKEMFATPNV